MRGNGKFSRAFLPLRVRVIVTHLHKAEVHEIIPALRGQVVNDGVFKPGVGVLFRAAARSAGSALGSAVVGGIFPEHEFSGRGLHLFTDRWH